MSLCSSSKYSRWHWWNESLYHCWRNDAIMSILHIMMITCSEALLPYHANYVNSRLTWQGREWWRKTGGQGEMGQGRAACAHPSLGCLQLASFLSEKVSSRGKIRREKTGSWYFLLGRLHRKRGAKNVTGDWSFGCHQGRSLAGPLPCLVSPGIAIGSFKFKQGVCLLSTLCLIGSFQGQETRPLATAAATGDGFAQMQLSRWLSGLCGQRRHPIGWSPEEKIASGQSEKRSRHYLKTWCGFIDHGRFIALINLL